MRRVSINEVKVEYNPAYVPYFNSRARYAILYGGAGSGKSVAVPQKNIKRIMDDYNSDVRHKFLCIRKYGTSLRDSVYAQCCQTIKDFGVAHLCSFRETNMTIEFTNGDLILCKGLDDPEKLKSVVMPTMGWLEETSEIEESDFDQINLRFRGEIDTYYQISMTFNPISETLWLKSKFFDGEQPNTFILRTNYKDNLFLDDQYKEILENQYKADVNMYRIYVDGEWGRVMSGTEFYNFKYDKHTAETVFDPTLPLHISFDFNVHPYMPVGIFQVKRDGVRWKVSMIDEIVGRNPDNSTERVCDLFMKKWGEHITQPVFVYGDSSGKNKSSLGGSINNFDIIGRVIGKWFTNQSLRVLPKNPLVARRRVFQNKIFNGEYNIDIVIDRRNKLMIDDLEVIKISIDGGKYKQKKKDPITGVAYETHGHFSDLYDYFMVGCFERLFLDMDL